MKARTNIPKTVFLILMGSLLLATPQVAKGQFTCTTNDNLITITRYTGSGGDVIIPNTINGLPVAAIADGAFFNCYGLTSVAIPDSVTSIGDYAFFACPALKAINVDQLNADYSSSVGVLFDKSQSLLIRCPGGISGSYSIPNSVTTINRGACYDCLGLTNVTIPDNVTSIGEVAFNGCSGLLSIMIPNSVTTIGSYAFAGCSQATSASIGNSVVNIGEGVFIRCAGLSSIVIPNSVITIGGYAFMDCSHLTKMVIGESVSSIGERAFDSCSRLDSVFFCGNAPAVDSSCFSYCGAMCYYLPGRNGWGFSLGGQRAYLWNPTPQTTGTNFGVGTSGFGFTIKGTRAIPIAVETTTNLTHGPWERLTTTWIVTGEVYFSDPAWTNHPNRFYRISMP